MGFFSNVIFSKPNKPNTSDEDDKEVKQEEDKLTHDTVTPKEEPKPASLKNTKSAKPNTKQKKRTIEKTETSKPENLGIQTIYLNNFPVRTFKFESEQYYCIYDIAKSSKVENPEKFLADFKKNEQNYSNGLAEVNIEESNETLLFADKQQAQNIIKSYNLNLHPETYTRKVKRY